MSYPILSLNDFSVKFPIRGRAFLKRHSFYAVHNINLSIQKNETLCLVGESGSGKTTLVWALLGLYPFHEGEIIFKGNHIKKTNNKSHKILQSNAQLIFQDPSASLNPSLTLGKSMEEPLQAIGIKKNIRKEIIDKLAVETGLSADTLKRHPQMVSGGQNQRACIARALSCNPDILFLDEPLTSLDALVKKEIIKLLFSIKKEGDLTFFLITHDLDFVKKIGTTVAVMYHGKIIEQAPKDSFFNNPSHPYSEVLLSSVLNSGPRGRQRVIINGDVPSPQFTQHGCAFHIRCPMKLPICEKINPKEKNIGKNHKVVCHLY